VWRTDEKQTTNVIASGSWGKAILDMYKGMVLGIFP
jgi:hypothetical protein